MLTVGIDEVGRGCWAGPVVAGAVLLPDKYAVPPASGWRLTDSKLLSAKARSAADEGIRQAALAIGLGWVTAPEVDGIGLTAAVRLAMQRALAEIDAAYDEIVIDGNYNFLADEHRARSLVKADTSVPAVSAASIVAKVARDNWMAEAALRYPQYGFEAHVGYGTSRHIEALRLHGPCALHRRSYRPVRSLSPPDAGASPAS